MKLKKKLLVHISVLLAVAAISSATILAAGNYGTQSDPLITLSYLTDVYKPAILNELNSGMVSKAQELSADFDSKIAQYKSELESGQSSTVGQNEPVTSKIVSLTAGQTVSCSIGTEILLRFGEVTGTGSAPALINTTDGTTLAPGSSLVTNHLYVVTIEGNGFKASTDNVKVLVSGNYTVS